jgi:NADH-quinone oxidoreductase subunit J
MNAVFYISAGVAVVATALVITRREAVHALLYLIVSLLAVAVDFFLLGAPFVAAIEVIIYAGAIMVLFVFVIMTLNVGAPGTEPAGRRSAGRAWIGPVVLASVLLAEVVYVLVVSAGGVSGGSSISPEEVGRTLYGPYRIGVELASLLLLAGLVGAYHLGRRRSSEEREGER